MFPRLYLLPAIMAMLLLPVMHETVFADSVQMYYGFKPGQKWLCTRMIHTQIMADGEKQSDFNKKRILYNVYNGSENGWVRLAAHYVDPFAAENTNTISQDDYNYIFSVEINKFGQLRDISVQTPVKSPIGFSEKTGLQDLVINGQQPLAESIKDNIFWFPELPETGLSSGNRFEEIRTNKYETDGFDYEVKSNRNFELSRAGQKFAYFAVNEKSTGYSGDKNSHQINGMGKGEIVFDLEKNIWSNMNMKRILRSAKTDSINAGYQDRETLIVEKITMELKAAN
ncbi:MAG: hypothetical protein GY874_12290 [Desulfobacteraceae bacterium]|nr:hypothetical protein [Desulfobacteraceae bacterium]